MIGNGASIWVWKDRWVPQPSTFHPISMPPPSSEDMRVQELIDVDQKVWRNDLLIEFFENEDMGHICTMPISSRLLPNKLIWHFSDRGIFTVKSAYWVAWDSVKPLSVSAYSSDTSGSHFT